MKLHRKMRGTARSGKWALGLRCTTSAYWIFKVFGGRFRTVLLTSLIFDFCGWLKTLGSNAGPLKSPWVRLCRSEYICSRSALRHQAALFDIFSGIVNRRKPRNERQDVNSSPVCDDE